MPQCAALGKKDNVMRLWKLYKGLLDKAEAIIERVILKGAKPDAKSWYSLAKVHPDHDQTEKAIELTRKAFLAVQPGWKTNTDVWAACLNYLIKKPDPEGAKEYIKLLTDENVITVITQERLLNKMNKTD
ncbi:pentatricopeptide repeat-containing protein At2g20710, mitochondrial-like [Rosa chinensis]|uniref:pentatricopeptide repeat-containing protein At2g20710, mitochondrial-like n=1 Tax=Rosa chinensis TaxID=74649 RepID=UPI001AD8C9BE|nr:pentatricopeptide repeat-containing protein At2g20710, mitochondrial-like [Rosa chinensis]